MEHSSTTKVTQQIISKYKWNISKVIPTLMFNRGWGSIASTWFWGWEGWWLYNYIGFLHSLSSNRWRCRSVKKTWRTFLLQNQCFGHRKAATALEESAECQQSEWKYHVITGKMLDLTILAAFGEISRQVQWRIKVWNMGKDDLIEAARLGNYPTCEKILSSKPKKPGPFAR